MTLNDTLGNWQAWIDRQPVDKDVRDVLRSRIAKQIRQNVPVILEFGQLSNFLGFSQEGVAGMVNRTEFFYREFSIPKRSGGVRYIHAPTPSLLAAQRCIVDYILEKVEVSEHAFGFVRGRSIKDNAASHLGTKCSMKTDIEDFFPSVGISRVIEVFKRLGYSNQVSYYFAKLCCFDDVLPQGAATSPILSNIIAKRLDSRMSGLAHRCGLIYTRYADDITFSGASISWRFFGIIERILQEEGFRVNRTKTMIISEPARRIITGISINGGRLTLPKERKRWIKKELYYVCKFGAIEHMRHEKIYDIIYLERLKGYVEFLEFVEGRSEETMRYITTLEREMEFLGN